MLLNPPFLPPPRIGPAGRNGADGRLYTWQYGEEGAAGVADAKGAAVTGVMDVACSLCALWGTRTNTHSAFGITTGIDGVAPDWMGVELRPEFLKIALRKVRLRLSRGEVH